MSEKVAHAGRRVRFSLPPGSDDFLGGQALARGRFIAFFQPPATDKSFDTPPIAAVTFGAVRIDAVVAPFAGDGMAAGQNFPAEDDAAAAAGAHDHAENQVLAAPGAAERLGHGESVGVVLQVELPAQQILQILCEWRAVQALGVGVAQQAGFWRDRARRDNAERVRSPVYLLRHLFVEPGNVGENLFVAEFLLGGDAFAEQLPVAAAQHDALYLRAPEIDT